MSENQLEITSAILITLFIGACSNHVPAPVIDLNISNHTRLNSAHNNSINNATQATQTTSHIVKAGETLFSIAWRYSLDYSELAKINGVKGNKIYPGQKLSLMTSLSNGESAIFNAQSLIAALNADILTKAYHLKPTTMNKSKLISHQSNDKHLKKSRLSKIKTTRAKNAAYSLAGQKVHTKSNIYKKHNDSVKRWIWPVNGKVVNYFSKKTNQNKGLDIVAKRGTAVRATAQGKVVYSGSGLRGYGQLVIIKHNDAYLSAYAHNEKIHVEENEFVKAGQRIADLGNSGSSIDKLHFEIRYKGKPVDPLNYLPKSGYL